MTVSVVRRREIVERKVAEEVVTTCWIQCWTNQKSRQDATYHFKLVTLKVLLPEWILHCLDRF